MGAFGSRSKPEWIVVLDRHERPTDIIDPESMRLGRTWSALQVNIDTPIAEARRRAAVRPIASRFQPLVCTDDAGRYLGIVRVERLIEQLVHDSA